MGLDKAICVKLEGDILTYRSDDKLTKIKLDYNYGQFIKFKGKVKLLEFLGISEDSICQRILNLRENTYILGYEFNNKFRSITFESDKLNSPGFNFSPNAKVKLIHFLHIYS